MSDVTPWRTGPKLSIWDVSKDFWRLHVPTPPLDYRILLTEGPEHRCQIWWLEVSYNILSYRTGLTRRNRLVLIRQSGNLNQSRNWTRLASRTAIEVTLLTVASGSTDDLLSLSQLTLAALKFTAGTVTVRRSKEIYRNNIEIFWNHLNWLVTVVTRVKLRWRQFSSLRWSVEK